MHRTVLITLGIIAIIAGGVLIYVFWTWTRSSPLWQITEEPNTYIVKIPSISDFVPIGVTYELHDDGLLTYTDDPCWKQSCFILVAIGWTEDGKHTLMYQGRLPFTSEGSFRPRICIDGNYLTNVPVFGGGMYYSPNGILGCPYPTVYVRGSRGYIETLSYDVENQRWIHIIKHEVDERKPKLEFVGKALGLPFWMGPMEGPYIVHGAYSKVKDIDIWGGFWVSGTFKANITLSGGQRLSFRGFFLFDRAIHRIYYGASASKAGTIRGPTGGVLAFSCMVIFHNDFIIMISHSDNPTPADFPKFQHQGRINFISVGESYIFNNFTLTDLGPNPLQPSGFHLQGTFEGGYVDLMGKVYAYWPPKGWGVIKGTWWDLEGRHCWGRAFVKWNGTIKLGDKVINVTNAVGIGEFTRYTSGSSQQG